MMINTSTIPSDDALVVTLDTENEYVQRILIINESSTDILFSHSLEKVDTTRIPITPYNDPALYEFRNYVVPIMGKSFC